MTTLISLKGLLTQIAQNMDLNRKITKVPDELNITAIKDFGKIESTLKKLQSALIRKYEIINKKQITNPDSIATILSDLAIKLYNLQLPELKDTKIDNPVYCMYVIYICDMFMCLYTEMGVDNIPTPIESMQQLYKTIASAIRMTLSKNPHFTNFN